MLIAGLLESNAETECQEDAVGKWRNGREHQSKADIHARPNQPRNDRKHRDDEKGRPFDQLACIQWVTRDRERGLLQEFFHQARVTASSVAVIFATAEVTSHSLKIAVFTTGYYRFRWVVRLYRPRKTSRVLTIYFVVVF